MNIMWWQLPLMPLMDILAWAGDHIFQCTFQCLRCSFFHASLVTTYVFGHSKAEIIRASECHHRQACQLCNCPVPCTVRLLLSLLLCSFCSFWQTVHLSNFLLVLGTVSRAKVTIAPVPNYLSAQPWALQLLSWMYVLESYPMWYQRVKCGSFTCVQILNGTSGKRLPGNHLQYCAIRVLLTPADFLGYFKGTVRTVSVPAQGGGYSLTLSRYPYRKFLLIVGCVSCLSVMCAWYWRS